MGSSVLCYFNWLRHVDSILCVSDISIVSLLNNLNGKHTFALDRGATTRIGDGELLHSTIGK